MNIRTFFFLIFGAVLSLLAAPPQWSPPENISAVSGIGSFFTIFPSQISVTNTIPVQGIATWTTPIIFITGVFVNRYNGNSWEGPILVSSDGGSHSSVDINKTSNLGLIAWIQPPPGPLAPDDVIAAPITVSSTLPPVATIVSASPPSTPPSIMVGTDVSGSGIVTWRDAILGDLLTNTFPPTVISNLGPIVLNSPISLAVNDVGNAALVWNDSGVSGSFGSYVGGVWATHMFAPVLNSASIDLNNVGPNGTAFFAGADLNSSIIETVVAIPPGVAPPITAISALGSTNENADVAANDAGQALAVWRNITNPAAVFIEASFFNGVSWSPFPVTISANGDATDPSDRPRVGIDSSGNGVATWGRFDQASSTYFIESAAYDVGTNTWSTITTIDSLTSATESLVNSDLDMSPSGGAIAIWGRNNGNFGILRASVFPFSTPPPNGKIAAPRNLQGCCLPNIFLAQRDEIKILTWDPSTSFDIVCYEVSRNGVVIAKVDPSCCSYRDHNRDCCCCDTYQVRAVASNGSKSNPATISF